jgi:hypothetical protein
VAKEGVTLVGSTRRYAVLSIAAAVLTISLKLGAYLLTGSVGLFSDAAESVVNLVAALAVLWALLYAARPPDEEHAFGHDKAEYFSSGLYLDARPRAGRVDGTERTRPLREDREEPRGGAAAEHLLYP